MVVVWNMQTFEKDVRNPKVVSKIRSDCGLSDAVQIYGSKETREKSVAC
jgi:hypothetical protein